MIISRSTHVAADGIISLFFMAGQYSIVYMYHISFIFLPLILVFACVVDENGMRANTG